jgi:hemerythrin superfamily protein
MNSQPDVVDMLTEQHHRIADLFRQTLETTGAERRAAFVELRRLIAAHETAEEVLVHPRMRWIEQAGDQVAQDRLAEEIHLKAELAELEKMDVESAEFAAGLELARTDSLAHNGAEETHEFPLLVKNLDDTQRARLRRGVQVVESMAPTRPHPGLALGGENVLAGGMVAVADRVRDMLSRNV